jgi:hypothetical protein
MRKWWIKKSQEMIAPGPLYRYIIKSDPMQLYHLYPDRRCDCDLLLSAAQNGKLVIFYFISHDVFIYNIVEVEQYAD